MNEERLYNLLPAIYRERDVAAGEPLRALAAVIESEYRVLERDIDALYNNWFIETCDEWVVPYIADLLAIRGLEDERRLAISQRALVANTIRYRRRKGTPAALEGAARDSTGWPVRVVEFFERLAVTQTLSHVRAGKGGSVDLRHDGPGRLDGPFATAAHSLDLRGVSGRSGEVNERSGSTPGKYRIDRLGLFVWRLRSYPLECRSARQIAPGCYTFNPLGVDTPLFDHPRVGANTLDEDADRGLPQTAPSALLEAELEARRRGKTPGTRYLEAPPLFQVLIRADPTNELRPVDAARMRIADLSRWERPNKGAPEPEVAIDPARGRLALAVAKPPAEIRVSFAYGLAADIGGGPYDRRFTLAAPESATWRAEVSRAGRPVADNSAGMHRFDSLDQALRAWAEADAPGLIEILDNASYTLPSSDSKSTVTLKGGHGLVIQAADGFCPCVIGDLIVSSTGDGARLRLCGLLVDGAVHLTGSVQLEAVNCTFKPHPDSNAQAARRPSITANGANSSRLEVTLEHCITGMLDLPADTEQLTVRDSIIGGIGADIDTAGDPNAVGPPTAIERTTVFGPVTASKLVADEVIFTAPVTVARRQSGHLRFCFVPDDSRTPPRYHCQPDLALENASEKRERTQAISRLKPVFTSRTYGQPGYGQLDRRSPLEIRSGAEDGSEMGAFQRLQDPQREANLRAAVSDYSPYGLEAGVYFVT